MITLKVERKIIGPDAAIANDTSTGKERDILITFIVVKFLEKKGPDSEGAWRLAVEKSKAWIAREEKHFDYHSMKGWKGGRRLAGGCSEKYRYVTGL